MPESAEYPHCLSCGATFAPESISRKKRFAICDHCGTIHNIASFYPEEKATPLQPIGLPRGVAFSESKDGCSISASFPLYWWWDLLALTLVAIVVLVAAIVSAHLVVIAITAGITAVIGIPTFLAIASDLRHVELQFDGRGLDLSWHPPLFRRGFHRDSCRKKRRRVKSSCCYLT